MKGNRQLLCVLIAVSSCSNHNNLVENKIMDCQPGTCKSGDPGLKNVILEHAVKIPGETTVVNAVKNSCRAAYLTRFDLLLNGPVTAMSHGPPGDCRGYDMGSAGSPLINCHIVRIQKKEKNPLMKPPT